MYDELIRRLRKVADEVDNDYDVDPYNAEHRCLAILQAADAIEELSKPRWISVKARLPEPYSWVLGFGFGETEMPIEVFYDGSEWKDSVLGGWYITHWMPLPTPPKEDEA